MALSETEVAKAMAPSKAWPYAGSEDGWVKAHNALRADMKDLAAALKLLAGAGSYNAWQVRGAASLPQLPPLPPGTAARANGTAATVPDAAGGLCEARAK